MYDGFRRCPQHLPGKRQITIQSGMQPVTSWFFLFKVHYIVSPLSCPYARRALRDMAADCRLSTRQKCYALRTR